MAARLITLDIKPYEGIGEFKLGLSLYQIIHLVQKQNLNFKIISNLKDLKTNTPIIVILNDLGIRFIFDAKVQVLIMIECRNFNNCYFGYNDTLINSEEINNNVSNINGGNNKNPTFKLIYSTIFGPTYPGFYNKASGHYCLSYPGICFNFEIPKNLNKQFIKATPEQQIQILDHRSNNVYCYSFLIFKGSSFEDGFTKIKNFLNESLYNIHYTKNDKNSLSLKNLSQNSNRLFKNVEINLFHGTIKLNFLNDRRNSLIMRIYHSRLQEIILEIGPPDSYLCKSSSNMKIHNYFKYGFDICYKDSIFRKIILHNNLINSLEFMRYEKLNWIVKNFDAENNDDDDDFKYFENDNEIDQSSLCTSDKTYSELKPDHFRYKIAKPIFLNRNEYEFINFLNNRNGFKKNNSYTNGNNAKSIKKLSSIKRNSNNYEFINYEDVEEEIDDDDDDDDDFNDFENNNINSNNNHHSCNNHKEDGEHPEDKLVGDNVNGNFEDNLNIENKPEHVHRNTETNNNNTNGNDHSDQKTLNNNINDLSLSNSNKTNITASVKNQSFLETSNGNYNIVDCSTEANGKHKNNNDSFIKKTPDRSKDWGITNLYFYNRISYEVLIENDGITAITIS
ncbi:hypothetical protein PACTADRAFT_15788 [Pachysolen tannophilus NRRL Y-2460]|uniref:Uncharacterized protein n=1 Tax=Pachysolen tannophilus NRRL Y-2460 TaxID=669874 RepID=A0A1E4TZY1_PACTA|nr:hypothetical protein PACTADRAFT_15788 [Pachysolen tannophilus NRRL Y-2460]